ncbi:hypothetical protein OY671_004070, partial [Metschnikowia pulcherrima]
MRRILTQQLKKFNMSNSEKSVSPIPAISSDQNSEAQALKRQKPVVRPLRESKKQRDELGFRLKQQSVDKNVLVSTGEKTKTIHEEETEGAHYEIEGPLRRVTPYFFTYLTYCKLRWRDRKLIDIFVDEFRDKDPEFYRKAIAEGRVLLNKSPSNIDSIVRNGDLISHRLHRHEPAVTSRPIK